MFLQRDWIRIAVGYTLNDLQIRYIEFISARRTFIGAHLAADDQARFLREILECIEDFGSNRFLKEHSLNGARAIAQDGEEQLPALAQIVEPSSYRDSLAITRPDRGDRGDREIMVAVADDLLFSILYAMH
jgi:hypothetical protein